MIDDIEVDVNLVLAGGIFKISYLKELGEGSVIELNRLAGEPVHLYVGKEITTENLIAKGEVVVLNEKFGLRITELVGG